MPARGAFKTQIVEYDLSTFLSLLLIVRRQQLLISPHFAFVQPCAAVLELLSPYSRAEL